MRDGRHVLTSELAGLTADDLVRAMVGRPMTQRAAGERAEPGELVLGVERLTREGVFTDISLDVRAGEIVALAGLVGSGRSEVARAVFGIDRYDAGRVVMRGRRAAPGLADLRHGRRHRLRPRGPAAAGPGHGHVGAAERGPRLARPAAQGRPGPVGRRAGVRGRLGGPAQPQVRPADRPGVPAVRRQPAEGGAGQVAGPPARRCSSWTSRPGASTSPPRPRCTGCSPRWPRTASRS